MKKALTPISVLDQYNIVGKKIPKDIIVSVRAQLESNQHNSHSWLQLIDAQAEASAESDQRVREQRAYVLQAISEVLVDTSDMTWRQRMRDFTTPQQYSSFFELLGIEEDRWIKSSWLSEHGFQGMYKVIASKFGGKWGNFLDFMKVSIEERDQTAARKIAECETKEDYEKVLVELGFSDKSWTSTNWLRTHNGQGIYRAVKQKFVDWKAFLDFMEIGMREGNGKWHIRIPACTSRNDFLKLFEEAGLPEDKWRNSTWLMRNRFAGLYAAIYKKFGGSWKSFLSYMEVPNNQQQGYWIKKVHACTERQDYLSVFKELGISDNKWQSCNYLQKNGASGVCVAIRKKFGGHWSHFLDFMGTDPKERKGFWNSRLAICGTPQEYKQCFIENQIPESTWISSTKLKLHYQALYKALVRKFKTFGCFSAFMAGAPIVDKVENEEQVFAILHSESERLEMSINELLCEDQKIIKQNCNKSPALKAVLTYFDSRK